MNHAESLSKSDVWQLDGTSAVLGIANLTGAVDLTHPENGIGSVAIDGATVDGFVLGVAAEKHGPAGVEADVRVLVRGDDLVASYPESSARPFSWQVYWRASSHPAGAVVLDAIVSVQTERLESFPELTLRSKFAGGEVWLVGDDGKAVPTDRRSMTEEIATRAPRSVQCILIRQPAAAWSYAEMTSPEDRGNWSAQVSDQTFEIRRQLGGEFLEKGVIRRARVRGALLPRQGDAQRAADLLRSLNSEQPPLTV